MGSATRSIESDSRREPVRLEKGEWLSEAVLWTEWEHAGDLEGLQNSHLFSVDAEIFGTIVTFYPSSRATASFYARKFVVALDHFGQIFTDLIDYTELFDD